MVEVTETEANLLARYFGMGRGSEIISHEPHETLGKHRHAWERLISIGLVRSEPYNQYGSKRFTCTDEAADIGRRRSQENMRLLLTDPAADATPEAPALTSHDGASK